jgi:hypothetical protein
MRKPIIILVIIFFNNYPCINAKDWVIYKTKYPLYALGIDYNDNTFDFGNDGYKEGSDQVVSTSSLYSGCIKINKSEVTCLQKNKTIFVLKRIDKFRLIVVKAYRYLKTNDTIYASVIGHQNSDYHTNCQWKGGKRDGYWTYYLKTNVKFEYYKNNKLIKTYYKTYEQINKDMTKNGHIW